MWNQKCGMTLIGRGDKPRDRWLSADYHTSLSTDSAVKCRPEMRKSLAMEADSIFSRPLRTVLSTVALLVQCCVRLSSSSSVRLWRYVLCLNGAS